MHILRINLFKKKLVSFCLIDIIAALVVMSESNLIYFFRNRYRWRILADTADTCFQFRHLKKFFFQIIPIKISESIAVGNEIHFAFRVITWIETICSWKYLIIIRYREILKIDS